MSCRRFPILTTCVCSFLREECVSLSNGLISSRGYLETLRLVFFYWQVLASFIYSARIWQNSTAYILNSYHPLIFSLRIETVYAKVGFGTDAHTLTALRLRILAAYLLFCIGSVFRFTLYVAHIILAWLPHNGWYSNFPGVTPYLQRKTFTSGGHQFLLNNVNIAYLTCSFLPTP